MFNLKLQMTDTYEVWLGKVREALLSINMPLDQWQAKWHFDFEGEYKAGAEADDAGLKANRFWWSVQNKSLNQDCQAAPDCWLPRGHQGDCQPVAAKGRTTATYEPGDVKVEFSDPATWVGEREAEDFQSQGAHLQNPERPCGREHVVVAIKHTCLVE